MKMFLVFIFLILFSFGFSQNESKYTLFPKNEGIWFVPQEFKYSGIIREKTYYSGLSISYHFKLYRNYRNDYRNHFSSGISYQRMFESNYLTIFSIYTYGSKIWTDFDKFIKLEPVFNVKNKSFEYINLEYNFSWFLGVSTFVGIPINFEKTVMCVGVKLGYYIPYPITILRKIKE